MRCVHESDLYDQNCFITLTYNTDNLPEDGGLHHSHFQKFMKRLRKKYGNGIRYFMCGEYGENFGRPHYHACLFNFDFPDKELWSIRDEVRLYVSESLNSLWGMGFCSIGDVTFESAAYVARYIMKKVTGDSAEEHYKRIDDNTGEIFDIKPEYTNMSRRPGIGRGWYDQFYKDTEKDFLTMRGIKMKPPKYYDALYESRDEDEFNKVKKERRRLARKLKDDNTLERLSVKEGIKKRAISRLKRSDVK